MATSIGVSKVRFVEEGETPEMAENVAIKYVLYDGTQKLLTLLLCPDYVPFTIKEELLTIVRLHNKIYLEVQSEGLVIGSRDF